MYIGIDETGDFKLDMLNFFISVFIRYKYLTKIESVFTTWEKSLPNNFKNSNGEVKGSLLSEEILEDFINNIIFNKYYEIRYCCYGVSTHQASWDHVNLQRKMTTEQLEVAVEKYKEQGKQYYKVANQYNNMLGWYKKLSNQNILKIAVLGSAVLDSLYHAICYSAIHKFDNELNCLEFKIDKDFIDKGAKTRNWKEILRNQLWNSRQGITILKEWDKSHPFLKTFIKDIKDNRVYLNNEFKKRINFYNSRFHWEIRIADIVATINRRYIVSKKCSSVFKKLRQSSFSKGLYDHLILTLKPDSIYNPFESK